MALKKVRKFIPAVIDEVDEITECPELTHELNVVLELVETEDVSDEVSFSLNNEIGEISKEVCNNLLNENEENLNNLINLPIITNKEVSENQLCNKELIVSYEGNDVRTIRRPKIAEGLYYFKIDNLRLNYVVKGKYGPYNQLIVGYRLKDYYTINNGKEAEEHRVTVPYIVSTNNADYSNFISKFKPIFNGHTINIKQLEGYEGVCKLYHYKTAKGDFYERVQLMEVFSLENK
ncbi:hypothetical protein [Sedimentibacter saalensis]|uniref:Uncharacterized protein n=1 Tax=Sedimentibacter saalensis TaxID=130788 RepID=A0A562JI51_9FIRM|nr:hypothetical protein [Sedimentibacter saalensis]TWH82565.1 hypothetical protein LY60_00866 [Sedimentibacter saalensis]